jgi:HemY protein
VRVLFFLLAGLIVAVFAGILLREDPGQIALSIPGYSIQTSMSFFVLLLLGGFAIFYFILRVLFGMLDFPKKYQRWKKTRAHARSEYFLSHGYLALAQGNWQSAEKYLSKGARYSRLPMVNYLGAARAAQQLGAIERRDSYLRQAHSEDQDSQLAVSITQAKLQLMEKQTEQAFAVLQHLDDEDPGQKQVKLMLLDASSKLQDWQQSKTVLQEIERKGLLPANEVRPRQIQVYANLLKLAAQSGEVNQLKETWQSVPKHLKREFFLLEVYFVGRLQYPDTADCEVMIRRIIKNEPDEVLVKLYGKVRGENPAKQLAFIEKLLKLNPTNHVVQLTAGRLYKNAEIWGKAKACLEQSLHITPTAECYYELAMLCEKEGNVENANRYFQQGLKLAAYGPETVIANESEEIKGLLSSYID